jgi:hypothetical protein
MNLRRALIVAACLLPWAAAPAVAQFQPPGQEPPCMTDFSKLRDQAEKLARAVMSAQKRKVPLSEACKLLTAFAVVQDKMLKFAKANQAWCGIPPQIVQQISLGHSNAVKARTNVCQAAAAPPRPAGPTLSDALGGNIPDPSNIKTGGGIFDTLTGTSLGK